MPTEAEWEYAARGGKAGCEAENPTDWVGTDNESQLGNYAWYYANAGSKTHEVAKKADNSLGLYDMSGNVWELCWDWYGTIETGTDKAGASSGSYRVRRGGCYDFYGGDCDDFYSCGYYDFYASYCSAAYRGCSSPYFRSIYLGFRVVRSAQ